ncbi:MBL fold metallo-hydrolase [Prosthecobacter sp.]|uniref:MBL fold metallo-hydrolase n=1 Tax=Prosthecobacter sp. TaxID=1965333 RepID=UPI002ABBFA76|nr:MBL fold metallo-hydrolase [Prosthecobacter sp.]MDZ4405824.1 MBL fold metallo-hydrolase [Prosthecobacter sp.]
MSIPLEDLFNDVIAKAQRGLGLSDSRLAAQSGLSVDEILDARAGKADYAQLLKLAPHLKLHGPSLVTMSHNAWRPVEVNLTGLAQFNTPWNDMTVNSYLVWDVETKNAAAFDTGANAGPMIEFIQKNHLNLSLIFLTHTHPDHIMDLAKLSVNGAVTTFVNERESCDGGKTFRIEDTESWQTGALKIEPRSTWGHTKGGITYIVSGLERPVAIVGDALFASSMGGGLVSYADALATNRQEIFTLPDNTVICPGHGPMTSVGEEKARNPFYPEFK